MHGALFVTQYLYILYICIVLLTTKGLFTCEAQPRLAVPSTRSTYTHEIGLCFAHRVRVKVTRKSRLTIFHSMRRTSKYSIRACHRAAHAWLRTCPRLHVYLNTEQVIIECAKYVSKHLQCGCAVCWASMHLRDPRRPVHGCAG